MVRCNGKINCNLNQAPQYEPGGALCSESKSTMIAGGNHLIIHGLVQRLLPAYQARIVCGGHPHKRIKAAGAVATAALVFIC